MVAIERWRRSTSLRLARGLLAQRSGAAVHALHRIECLPLYQVALWPDGWELIDAETVLVRDTHEMAEARRWYAMAARNSAVRGGRLSATSARTMRLHGIGIPSPLLALVGRRFVSEQAASVAVRLVASDWVEQRRRMLIGDAARMLRLQSLTWCGSRYGSLLGPADLSRLVLRLLALCIEEGLLPMLRAEVDVAARRRALACHEPITDVRVEDGYGLTTWHCRVRAGFDRPSLGPIAEILTLALIPWNRSVLRDERPWQLLQVEVVTECAIN